MKDAPSPPPALRSPRAQPGRSFVFGPVPSRRLGRSLGIDTVPPKTCNWNCVYCQLGRTHPLRNTRAMQVAPETIVAEFESRLAELPAGSLDWITFVASGEGTLYAGLGQMLREVKRRTRIPVAVITNGSLLDRPEVREELRLADAVLPTLDAGDEATFLRINRPHRGLTWERHVAGIEAFAHMEGRGRLWIEVMLVAGLNDGEEQLHKMAALFARIAPDEIHLTLPSRCPVEPWVRAPDEAGLVRAQAILGAKATFAPPPGTTIAAACTEQDLAAIVKRHPLRRDDLPVLFPSWSEERLDAMVARLLAGGDVAEVERAGTCFLVAAELRYATKDFPRPPVRPPLENKTPNP